MHDLYAICICQLVCIRNGIKKCTVSEVALTIIPTVVLSHLKFLNQILRLCLCTFLLAWYQSLSSMIVLARVWIDASIL